MAVSIPDRRFGTVVTAVETLTDRDPYPRGVPVYVADPYAAWQRGTKANTNGLLRECFPKGMDLARLTRQEVDYVIALIHRRPRNGLHGKTTEDVFQEEGLHLNGQSKGRKKDIKKDHLLFDETGKTLRGGRTLYKRVLTVANSKAITYKIRDAEDASAT